MVMVSLELTVSGFNVSSSCLRVRLRSEALSLSCAPLVLDLVVLSCVLGVVKGVGGRGAGGVVVTV